MKAKKTTHEKVSKKYELYKQRIIKPTEVQNNGSLSNKTGSLFQLFSVVVHPGQ
jgi:hypothetical protein